MNDLQWEYKDEKTPRTWVKFVRRVLIVYGFIPYLSITAIFVIFQRSLMYRPTIAPNLAIGNAGLSTGFGRDVQIQSADGNTLKGWIIRHTEADVQSSENPLVIYFSGNPGNRFERLADLREVAATGFDILIFDYRGFGDSTGNPTESALTADAPLIWNYACSELKYDQSRIVIFGESLGGAVALSLWSGDSTAAPHPASVVLNSTFGSMADVVGWHYPWFPFRFLLLDRWRSVDRISRISSHVCVFHGTADEIVPVSQGRALASKSANAEFIEIPGGSQNDIPMTQLRQEFDRLFASLRNKPENKASQ